MPQTEQSATNETQDKPHPRSYRPDLPLRSRLYVDAYGYAHDTEDQRNWADEQTQEGRRYA